MTAAQAPSGRGSRGAGRPRVVLVEDHVRVREHLVVLLEAAGFDVVAAVESRAAGHRAILEHRPDLAVVDNRLPDGRGAELAAALRDLAPGVGVLIHSGAITPEETATAMRSGVLEVVGKDVRARSLIDALRRHATGSRR
ncbi:response regulator transcription factor [Actinomycetospora endophytica]|uniref:Response regulator transcription factor n=1 Tax=Actinomycetospora endophytica TaxID=2291215 RepID=A0ABS8PAN0_9PSEU|nr:response regulator transcription factor [Actinomycetospora endophytica]MCD2195273.1 response regulator transcription factor [Actinomycetospora endophytica]